MWWLVLALVIIRIRWRLVSTVAIDCKPGQARKGAAAAIDSGAVIGLVVTFFSFMLFIRSNFPVWESCAACGAELKAAIRSNFPVWESCATYGAELKAAIRSNFPFQKFAPLILREPVIVAFCLNAAFRI